MGASFTNCQVRSDDANAVVAVLTPLLKTRGYVSPPYGGWVTVYDEATESQDTELLIALAQKLSKALKTTVFGILVHDSDIAAYWLCQSGAVVDEYDSCPDYFGNEVSAAERQKVRGDTDKLLPLCMAGTTREQIDAVIHPTEEDSPVFAEDIIRELGKLLGMEENRASLGFEYFENEGGDIVDDFADFVLIEKGASTPKITAPAKAAAPAPKISAANAKVFPEAPVLKLDMLPVAVTMMAREWTDLAKRQAAELAKILPPDQADALRKQIADAMEKNIKGLVKASKLPNAPTYEELKAARDAGPDALAALLAQRTPGILGSVASQAIGDRMEAFVAALLKHGLDPNAADHHGHKILDAAKNLGTDSPFYKMLKEAAEKQG